MKNKTLIISALMFMSFSLGVALMVFAFTLYNQELIPNPIVISPQPLTCPAPTGVQQEVAGPNSSELSSPFDRIKESQISVYRDRVMIDLKNAEWATFTDTNSMDPIIDSGANALEIVPASEKDIHLGDIVSYESDFTDGVLIHRVVEIGYDELGWYMKAKGDNNNSQDPGRIRFSQVKRVVVAIIY
jgi:hypothetical protein